MDDITRRKASFHLTLLIILKKITFINLEINMFSILIPNLFFGKRKFSKVQNFMSVTLDHILFSGKSTLCT